MFRRILIATDGSEFSRKAAEQAVAPAAEVGASLLAMTTADRFPAYLFPREVVEHAERALKSQCREIVSGVQKVSAAACVACETEIVAHQAPYQAIIEPAAAEGCDLIVMGSHGRSGIKALILGSVKQDVLAHAKLPVLVSR